MLQQELEQIQLPTAAILVVEDDPGIQGVLQYLLTSAGYRVIQATSGTEALDALKQEYVDLVLLDIMLPNGNGYEICEHIRRSSMANLPVLMLTALTQPQHASIGLQIGADDYIKKPFSPAELMLRVRNLLRRYHETQTLQQDVGALQQMLELVQRQLETSRSEVQTEVVLRREFLHNVVLHMQALLGMVQAELRKLPPSPERAAVQRIRSRLAAAALVYQVSEALQSDLVDIGYVIRTIASALNSMYRPWKNITLTINGEVGTLPATLAAPLAMIVNELVTNAFKHAFPENRFGTIEIGYGIENATFFFTIVDNGVGFAAHQPTTGRGRATVTQLVQGLGGTIDWQSAATGTQVTLQLPLSR